MRAGNLTLWLPLFVAAASGCGTTKWSDTPRTATEQLLISDAVDQAVSDFDFSVLAGKAVFFDKTYLKGSIDENYVVSSLRQHLLASGCFLMETLEAADYVVEARAGAVGTDRSDLLFGMPSVTVPTVPGLPVAMPSSIPEIPLAKTTKQKAVAKLAVFAYNRRTGRPVFQTGVDPAVSTARDSWLFGAGPFRKGTVYDHHQVLDSGVDIPIIGGREQAGDPVESTLSVTAAAVFAEPSDEQTLPHDSRPNDNEIAGARPTTSSAASSTAPTTAQASPGEDATSTASAAVAETNSPTQLSNERLARLPPVDQSGINAGDQTSSVTAPGPGVQRAQFTEPVPLTSPPASSRPNATPRAVPGPEQQTEEPGSWSIWRPGTWFGKSKE